MEKKQVVMTSMWLPSPCSLVIKRRAKKVFRQRGRHRNGQEEKRNIKNKSTVISTEIIAAQSRKSPAHAHAHTPAEAKLVCGSFPQPSDG